MVALPFVVMIVALLLGVPIAICLAGSGLLGLWLVTGDLNVVISTVAMMPYSSSAQYILTTIPMFVLMAYLSASSGLARDLYAVGASWLGHIRGGLGIATVFACCVFGAMSGASFAAAAVMGKIAMPEMRRHGYSEELAAGAIAIGATLDLFIPPCIATVVYGLYTGTSIGKLLIAGIVPGILVAIFLSLAIYIWVLISPSHAPKTYRASWPKRLGSLRRAWSSLLLILIVLTFLYTGIGTPTEVGALGAFMAMVIGVALRRLTWPGTIDAFKGTIRTSAMIYLLLIGANIFGNYMAFSGVPQHIAATVMQMNVNKYVVIVGIIITYFLVSMFMDEMPLLLITLQVTFPLIVALGFDPIWFGVMSMIMISMGLVFPPVGLVAFVVSSTANVRLVKVYKGTSILMIAHVLTAVLIIIFPEIVLYLPSTMR